ncbi:MAG: putative acetyltransferase [Halieaceae bacterium]|jgi:putative acetyltransferase
MISITEDDLSGAEISALLRAHVQGMHDTSPLDSINTLSLDALGAPDITVWTAWEGSALLACGTSSRSQNSEATNDFI